MTFSPHYHPQNNGKAEATVMFMKKLISAAWIGRSVNWDHLARALLQYRNTPCWKDGDLPKRCLAIQFKTPSLLIADHSYLSFKKSARTWIQLSQTPHIIPKRDMTSMHTPSSWQSCRSSKPHIQALGYLWHHYCHWSTSALLCLSTKWSGTCQKQAIHS